MHEQVCYQKSFLKQVIAKVDFASPIVQLEKNVPKKLLDAIVKSFPIIEPVETLMHEVLFNADSVQSNQTKSRQWNYFSKDRGRQLTLAPQSIFISYSIYKNFEEAKEQFGSVIDALIKTFPEATAARFGLRYINQIDLDISNPLKWDEYIDANLLGNSGFFNDTEKLTRLISIAEINNEDINIRFQFGMPNPDYPAPVRRPLYILDLDASVSQAHDLSEVMPYMVSAHNLIQAIYERSITPKLREKMNVRSIQ